MAKNKKKSIKFKLFTIIFFVIIIFIGYAYYILKSTEFSDDKNLQKIIYIPTNSNFDQVLDTLTKNGIVTDPTIFRWIAEKKNYQNLIKPGKYSVYKKPTNNLLKEFARYNILINKLRIGKQVEVIVTFHSIRTKNQLAGRLAKYLEPDSISFAKALSDIKNANKYGFNNETFLCMFIPNTYHLYWNTSIDDLFKRMAAEYKKFWNSERIQKANLLNLTQSNVSILASIVQSETIKSDEKPKIAGVYLNRIKKGMLLQADPTVIFAWKDFSIKRVLKVHLSIDSKYNTYKYKGLPPGPICLPSIESIDAVLNYEKHNYIYFCAKSDFSGYHNFARNLKEHNQNAREYQKALRK